MKRQPTHQESFTLNIKYMLIAAPVLSLVVVALWYIAAAMQPKWLRAWAMLATIALPVTAWVSWRIGHVRSDALVEGIDTGIDKVSNAAKRFRQPPPRVQVANVLPQARLPQVIHRQLSNGEEDIVEL